MIEISFMEDSVNMNYDLFFHLLEKEKQGAPQKHPLGKGHKLSTHYHTAPLVKITERC